MPISADAARPMRTVDTHGRTLSTDTNGAAPMKVTDAIGRPVVVDVKADAKAVATQAAASNPELPKDAADFGEKPAEANGEAKPTEAEIRKEWLSVQKEKRKAASLLKSATERVARADAMEKAKALAESGEDPTELLKAAGLDPVKYYQNLTKHALKQPAPLEDPVQKELREHREAMDKFQAKLDAQAKALQDREDNAAHNQVITEKVIPLLRDNPEKYELLSEEYGANAAIEVYKTVWEIYQQTGEARSFTEVADEMEEYWHETIRKGIDSAAKLKKFANRFAQADASIRQTPDPTETPKRSVTLSNRPSASAPSVSVPATPRRSLTRDERVAEILKKFGD